MYSELFEEVGLSPNEAKIYETLLSTGETSVSTIAVKAKIHRRNIYDAINRLVSKGLVSPIFQKGENQYQAVSPDKLIEILKEKETKLHRIMPDLKRVFTSTPENESAFIYKGIEGFKNLARDMARIGEDGYFIGAKGLWFSKGLDESFLKNFIDSAKKRKIKYYTLYDSALLKKFPHAAADIGGEYKFLPEKYSAPGVVDIFGDHVVTYTGVGVGNIGEDTSIFVMINRELAESYKIWFRFMWDLCPAVKENK